MFQGKMKAITFSYDDGITQDKRLIKMFNRYGLKATFNLNSGLLGQPGLLDIRGTTVAHVKPRADEVAAIYEGHEVAVHTLTHPLLPSLTEAEIIRQVEEDRLALSNIVGYSVVGMAYPCGGKNYNSAVADLIREKTGVRYARTTASTHTFAMQENLYEFHPTIYHQHWDDLLPLAEKFLALEPEEPALFYIWGHSYELDYYDSWERFDDFLRLISGRGDIFYGTNREVLGL